MAATRSLSPTLSLHNPSSVLHRHRNISIAAAGAAIASPGIHRSRRPPSPNVNIVRRRITTGLFSIKCQQSEYGNSFEDSPTSFDGASSRSYKDPSSSPRLNNNTVSYPASGKVFVGYTIHKGKAVLDIEPRAPEFTTLEIHRYAHGTRCFAATPPGTNPVPESGATPDPETKPKRRGRPKKTVDPPEGEKVYPTTIPRKPRRGRRSEAVALEDYVRDSLEKTFTAIREQNAEVLENKEKVLKERVEDVINAAGNRDEEDDDKDGKQSKMVVDEDDPNWALDADVGWGIRASEYFEKHPIKNIVGEDGVEIDWEGETDDNWVKEINSLEWESFAFHPSPLIVLVFERYHRPTANWKLLKEMEKALLVYWKAKDRLPPRAVKIDINLERDLAYALQVRECPQILFLRGHKILYREKEFRTAEHLVNMIAYFYYKAKKPSWIDDAALAP